MVEIWPSTLDSFVVFEAMLTQWRQGFAGPTGLDYAALPVVLDLCEVAAPRRRQVFDDVRRMESAALTAMREKHGRK